MRPHILLSFAVCAFLMSDISVAAPATSEGGSAHTNPSWLKVDTQGQAAHRHESSAVAIDSTLYVFGGRGERPLQALDMKSKRWKTLASPPIEIHHAQGVAHEGRIFVVSGLTGNFPEEPSLDHVHIYDPATNAWSLGPEIPAARRRGASGVVVIGDLAYILGGNTRGHNSGFVPWVDSLNLATGEWSVLPNAPHARDHFHAAVVDGRIYAAGGRRSAADAGEPLSLTIAQVDVFDPAKGAWSTLDAELPTPRAGTAAVAFNDQLVVLGGESARQVPAHAEVEAFDPKAGKWKTLPPMPAGRHGAQAVVSGDALWITAGSGDRGGGPELNDVIRLKGPTSDR